MLVIKIKQINEAYTIWQQYKVPNETFFIYIFKIQLLFFKYSVNFFSGFVMI